MKIRIASDLHLEFRGIAGSKSLTEMDNDCDVLVVAGDLANSFYIEESLNAICKRFPQVVYVTGNHEYYHSSFTKLHGLLKSIDHKNFYWLHDTVAVINNQRFLGNTLWFPETPETLNSWLQTRISDFGLIENFTPDVFHHHDATYRFLKNKTTSQDIVVTHHLPHRRSISPKFEKNALNCYFQCDMDEIIENNRPKLWIHGHSHDHVDYTIGDTRIVSCPIGYPSENYENYLTKPLLYSKEIEI